MPSLKPTTLFSLGGKDNHSQCWQKPHSVSQPIPLSSARLQHRRDCLRHCKRQHKYLVLQNRKLIHGLKNATFMLLEVQLGLLRFVLCLHYSQPSQTAS